MKWLRITLIVVAVLGITAVSTLLFASKLADNFINESIAQMVEDIDTGIITETKSTKIDSPFVSNAAETNSIEANAPNNIKKEAGSPEAAEASSPNPIAASSGVDNLNSTAADSISSKDIKSAGNSIPLREKVEVTKMVLSKLSSTEISELSAMTSEGISSEEKRKAKEIVYSKFTPQEIEYIKQIYYKYVK